MLLKKISKLKTLLKKSPKILKASEAL